MFILSWGRAPPSLLNIIKIGFKQFQNKQEKNQEDLCYNDSSDWMFLPVLTVIPNYIVFQEKIE